MGSVAAPNNFKLDVREKVNCVLSAPTLEGKREEILQVYRRASQEGGFRVVNLYADQGSFDRLQAATKRDQALSLERGKRVAAFEKRAVWARIAMIVNAIVLAIGFLAGYIVLPALAFLFVAAIAKKVFSYQAKKAKTDLSPVRALQQEAFKGLWSVHNEKMRNLFEAMGAQWIAQYHKGSDQQKSDILADAEMVVKVHGGGDIQKIRTFVPVKIFEAATLIAASGHVAKKNN